MTVSIHKANAYPLLVAQLKLICESGNDNIVRAGYINAARDLLRELGELHDTSQASEPHER